MKKKRRTYFKDMKQLLLSGMYYIHNNRQFYFIAVLFGFVFRYYHPRQCFMSLLIQLNIFFMYGGVSDGSKSDTLTCRIVACKW